MHDVQTARACFRIANVGQSHFSPRETEQYNYSKCSIIVRILEFSTMVLKKCPQDLWKVRFFVAHIFQGECNKLEKKIKILFCDFIYFCSKSLPASTKTKISISSSFNFFTFSLDNGAECFQLFLLHTGGADGVWALIHWVQHGRSRSDISAARSVHSFT